MQQKNVIFDFAKMQNKENKRNNFQQQPFFFLFSVGLVVSQLLSLMLRF
jgi:hypothetical protein